MDENMFFLLKYAKKGVLQSMKELDPIEREELKHEYIRIKNNIVNGGGRESPPNSTEKKEKKGESAISKWFHGIGDRQRKYKEAHKDDLL